MNDFGLDVAAIESAAQRELRDERFREAVDARKARMREQSNKGLWQRLIDKLPFTITWKGKSK